MAATFVFGAGPSDARDIPKSELVRLVGTDTEAGDGFGASVSAQNRTLVVGAPGDDNRAGAAYVFVRDSTGQWVQQAKLVAPDGAFGDNFGARVSVSVDTIVVTNSQGSRAAHIFWRTGSTWTRRQRIQHTGGPPLEVAVDGPRVTLLSLNSGNAYMYRRNSSLQWTQQATLKADTGQPIFRSVQMSDGMAVFGAPYFGSPSGIPGSAYVFTSTTVDGRDQWRKVVRLHPTGHDSDPDDFGAAVDIGQQRVLVGSPMEGGFFNGAAYFFGRRADGTWAQTQRVTSQSGLTYHCFGGAVALHFDRSLVDVPCSSPGSGGAQISVEIFGRDASTNLWSRQDRLVDPSFHASALSTCGTFVGAGTEDAVYVLPAESC